MPEPTLPFAQFPGPHTAKAGRAGHTPWQKGQFRPYAQGELPHGRRQCLQIDPAMGSLGVFCPAKKAFYNSYSPCRSFQLAGTFFINCDQNPCDFTKVYKIWYDLLLCPTIYGVHKQVFSLFLKGRFIPFKMPKHHELLFSKNIDTFSG